LFPGGGIAGSSACDDVFTSRLSNPFPASAAGPVSPPFMIDAGDSRFNPAFAFVVL
jgi:hypothetical protein